MAASTSRETQGFDAFISYSRDDEAFAAWLETRLERYRPPAGIGSGRRLKVFRDVTDLVGATLSASIEDALRRSRHLIVLCSPSARDSPWVSREIEAFAAAKGTENIIPVLIDGRRRDEANPESARPVLPAALAAFRDEPLAADFRTRNEFRAESRTRRREALFFVLARLLAVEKEVLVNRQRRRTMRLLALAVVVLSLVAVSFALISVEAMRQRDEARKQVRIATSRQLAAQSLINLDDSLELSLLLAAQSRLLDENADTLGSLLSGLARAPNLIAYLRGHTGRLEDLAFDDDAVRLASASSDGTIQFWDVATGRKSARVLQAHDGAVEKIHFTPDGNRLVSVGEDKTIRIWNARSLEPISSASYNHPEEVGAVAISNDGRRVAVAGRFRISIWDTASGRALGPPFGDEDQVIVHSLAFSPDGSLLVAGYEGGNPRIRVLDVETQRPLDPFPGTTATALAFSADGRKLASGIGNIRVWDVATRSQIAEPLVGHVSNIDTLVFSADGQYLASASLDRTLRFWDLKQHRILDRPLRGFGTSILVASNDGKLLSAGGKDGSISLWSTERWDPAEHHRLARRFETPDPVTSLTFDRDGARLFLGDEEGHLLVWDVKKGSAIGEPVQTADELTYKQISKLVLDPTGTILALGHFGIVSLWDLAAGKPLVQIQHGERITQHIPAIAFDPGGRVLATGGMDGVIRLWKAQTGEPLAPPMVGHDATVLSIAWSPDGKRIASAGGEGSVRLWDASTFEAQGEPLRGEQDPMIAVFFPDEEHLVAVSTHAIHRWRLPDRKPLRTLILNRSLSASNTSVALRSDGRLLAILRPDGAIEIWDLQAEMPLGDALPQDEVQMMDSPSWGDLAYSPDGKLIASKGGGRYVRIWDVNFDDWHRAACRITARNLSLLEWEHFVGPLYPYCRTCEELPSGSGAAADAASCLSLHPEAGLARKGPSQ